MTLYDSNRPSLDRIRGLAEARGEILSDLARRRPHGCGDGRCESCAGALPDEQERPGPSRGRRTRLPERDDTRPPKDPRYAWLPP